MTVNSNALQILMIEDNVELAETTMELFELEGLSCDLATTGIAGIKLMEANRYDVLVLDVNLPRMSGLKVCQTLREQGNDIPIIMLTALNSLDNKISGFNSGADDYLTKPFAFQELLMRVRVLSRRRSGETNVIKVKDLSMNIGERRVMRSERIIKLSPTGYKLLEVLLRSAPNPVSREQLVQRVWGEEQPNTNSLKVHMFKLRKALDDGYEEKLIHTINHYGFVIK